ncbi:MAG: hypothetical protein IT256_02475 [Chitinophagaceae bacterium]|nr:hypothetical protein [Chitinophagaceae bacterium]
MKNYEIIKLSTMWSTDGLRNDVERILNEKSRLGYEIVSVSFGINLWWAPTAFITLASTIAVPAQ